MSPFAALLIITYGQCGDVPTGAAIDVCAFAHPAYCRMSGPAVDNGPVHFLKSFAPGVGGNGVGVYGPAPAFPTNTYKDTNYWVDVVFNNANGAATIWPASALPAEVPNFSSVDWPDLKGVELGVKFKADTDGIISALRFYKSAANIGPHTVSLWALDGTLLGRGVTSTEISTGWQQVALAAPVPILAGAVYIASYYAPAGHYSATINYFGSPTGFGCPFTPDSFDVVVDAKGDGNAPFAYAATNTFPTSFYQGNNYWVDVSFQTPDQQTVRIWPDNPASAVHSDENLPVNVGLTFRADTDGAITAIHFYKSAADNLAPHDVSLWNAEGTLLARATSANETDSGWQTVPLAAPVPVKANTVYIASYLSRGHISITPKYFAAGDIDQGPLHAPGYRSGVCESTNGAESQSPAVAGGGIVRLSVPATPRAGGGVKFALDPALIPEGNHWACVSARDSKTGLVDQFPIPLFKDAPPPAPTGVRFEPVQ